MVTTKVPDDIDAMARDLADRLIRRNRVPERLRATAESFLRTELTRSLRRVSRETSSNAAALLAFQRAIQLVQ